MEIAVNGLHELLDPHLKKLIPNIGKQLKYSKHNRETTIQSKANIFGEFHTNQNFIDPQRQYETKKQTKFVILWKYY